MKLDCTTLPPTLMENEPLRSREGCLHRRGCARGRSLRGRRRRHVVHRRDRRARAAAAGQAAALPAGPRVRARGRLAHAGRRRARDRGDAPRPRGDGRARQRVSRRPLLPLQGRPSDAAAAARTRRRRRRAPRGALPRDLRQEAQQGVGHARQRRDCIACARLARWPGNIRELEHCIEAAVVLSDRATIEPAQLSLPNAPATSASPKDDYVARTLAEVEREHIVSTLRVFGGNRSEAARALGIGRNTLLRKLKTFGVRVALRAAALVCSASASAASRSGFGGPPRRQAACTGNVDPGSRTGCITTPGRRGPFGVSDGTNE